MLIRHVVIYVTLQSDFANRENYCVRDALIYDETAKLSEITRENCQKKNQPS